MRQHLCLVTGQVNPGQFALPYVATYAARQHNQIRGETHARQDRRSGPWRSDLEAAEESHADKSTQARVVIGQVIGRGLLDAFA
jgi:hypothetical protein